MSDHTMPDHTMSSPLIASRSNTSLGRQDGAGQRHDCSLRGDGGTAATLVVALLAAVAYWGQASDWSFTSLSSLLGNQPEAESEWCAEHNVPEADCIECNVGLVEPDKDFGWVRQARPARLRVGAPGTGPAAAALGSHER